MASRNDPHAVPIEELGLTVRCYNILKREGINTVGQLAVLSRRHIMGLRNFAPKDMDALQGKLSELGLSPWAARQPAQDHAGRGTAGPRPGSARPSRLWRGALSAAGALLPAGERDRWVEEWEGELHALSSPKARAGFILSLLFVGARKLAVALRHPRPGDKSAWPAS